MEAGLEPKKMPSLVYLAVGLAGALVLVIIGGLIYFGSLLEPLEPASVKQIEVKIPQGSTTVGVARLLEREGIVQSSLGFSVYTRWSGRDSTLRAGEYLLSPGMSVREILDKLASGAVEIQTFTIPEGYTIRQMAELLNAKGYGDRDRFIEAVGGVQLSYDYLPSPDSGELTPEARLEGYLFPATYKITKGTPEEQIVRMMAKRFDREITPEFRKKAKALGLTVNQAVTLASIVEREAKRDSERPMVAAVFLNRIRLGMKLESCATVQYALGETKERLLYKDLQVDSPYNTYKIAGLPPGPIASPGHASLQAAVNPAKVDYLYFVVSESGHHAFSRTLAEHNRNKQKYLARVQNP